MVLFRHLRNFFAFKRDSSSSMVPERFSFDATFSTAPDELYYLASFFWFFTSLVLRCHASDRITFPGACL